MICRLVVVDSFVNSKNKAPIEGNSISEDKIGKSINLKLKMLKLRKNLEA